MLSGASRNRPVIVGWSTALRGEVINESLGQHPKKLAAGRRVLARTESSRTQSGTKQGGSPHDHWAKLGQLRYTRSQYSFVVIALFSMKLIAPPSKKKKDWPTVSVKIWALGGRVVHSTSPEIVGKQYPVAEQLAKAYAGQVSVQIEEPYDDEEHEYERRLGKPLFEIYSPVRE